MPFLGVTVFEFPFSFCDDILSIMGPVLNGVGMLIRSVFIGSIRSLLVTQRSKGVRLS